MIFLGTARAAVSLRSNFVSEPAPWCQECCVVAAFRVNGDRIISIPDITDTLLCARWYSRCQVKWRVNRECLPGGVFVQGLVVDGSPRVSICFSSDDHSRLPSHWGVVRYLFNDSYLDVLFQVGPSLSSAGGRGPPCDRPRGLPLGPCTT